MKPRPKTGERREVRQPLKIDRLPEEMRDEILALRSVEGLTWQQIEERSPSLRGWEKAEASVARLFPGKRIPHTNLQRWYDLRVEQVQRQVLAETQRAREFAQAFAERGFDNLPEAVMNALRDSVFTLLDAADMKSRVFFMKALSDFGWLVAQFKKVEIAGEKVQTESRRVKLLEEEAERKRKVFEKATNEAATKLGKGKGLTLEDINRLRERTFGLPPVQRSAPAGNPA